MGNRWGNIGNIERLYFFVLQNLCRWWLQPWNWKMLAPWKKSYDQPRHHIKKQKHYFANKGPSSQSYGFFSSHVWMWELDYKESWVPKNWDFWTLVLEKTLESPLESKEIQPVHSKGDQSCVFIGRTDAEAEAPILWPPDARNWLIWKDPDAGKDWRQGGEGDSRGWEGWMASPTLWMWVWVNSGSWWWTGVLHSWGHKDSDTTEWLNWNWKRVLCLWNSPGKNTGDGSHFLLRGLFLTQGSNPGLLPCMHTLLPAPTREAHIKV